MGRVVSFGVMNKECLRSFILPWKLVISIQLHIPKVHLRSLAAWVSDFSGDEILFETFMGRSFLRKHLEQRSEDGLWNWISRPWGRNEEIVRYNKDENKKAEFIERNREVVKKLRLTRETTEPRRDHLQHLKENCQCSEEHFKIIFQYSQLWTGLFVHATLLCQIPKLHFAQL